ncbi:MAG TPA: YifB family Mg chelatase-like AAA ATPase [Candidatus Limnocylindrales bacterium]|nr:YifB family Mg chelatase-like AAA ATPase [Candidatus Limnocylindrales bacterium]
MLATLVTAVVNGLRGELIRVEVDVAPGLPACNIVGLPDAALSEARERVRAAIRNSGFEYPASRITVNLAPADRRKRGAAYDLAIAVGVLLASGQIRNGGGPWALIGELGLSGELRTLAGALPMVSTLVRAGHRRIGLPLENVAEAEMVTGVHVVGLAGLDDAARLVAGPRGRIAARARRRPTVVVSQARDSGSMRLAGTLEPVDLAEVRGQQHARWAVEVALAGGHNLLMVGPPGAGKTLLARAIPGLLPPLHQDEALEVAVIESVAGILTQAGPSARRPFRAPHHTSSYAALVGGGPGLMPGEASLAHRGVLFLDELAEFDRNVLDALREPLEEGVITIARANGRVRYPARFQLVAAMNRCRCGQAGTDERPCRCPTGDADRYVARVSGPFIDRLDLRIDMARVRPAELLSGRSAESSALVAARIAQARARQHRRAPGIVNAMLPGGLVQNACAVDRATAARLVDLAEVGGMSARGIHRVMRVARTIADLADRASVSESDVLAAAALREPGDEARSGRAA